MRVRTPLRSVPAILSILFLACIAAGSAFGQAAHSVTGFVFDTSRNRVPDIQIELLDEFNRTIIRAKTDGSGRYNFQRLNVGRYAVRVMTIATNFEEQTKEVEVVSSRVRGLGGSSTTQLDIYLRTRREAKPALASSEVVFAQDVPPEAKRQFQNGVSNIKEKRVDEGIANLKAAIQIYPDYYLALENLGQEYIGQQNFAEAINVLARAVGINPRSYISQYSLGYSMFQLKKYPEAQVALKRALDMNGSSANCLFLYGVTFKHLGQYVEAEQNLKKAAKLTPSPMPEIHWQLSLIYTNNLKNYSAAADELELFLRAKPDYEEAGKVRELISKLKAKAKQS